MIEREAMFYAEFIKDLRKKEGLSLKKLGELLGVSGQAILNIESGKTKKPSKKIITKVSNYTKINEEQIYNAIFYGAIDHKSAPFAYNEHFKSIVKEHCTKNKISLHKETEGKFTDDVVCFFNYIYTLKADWTMRYDTKQTDYMVKAIHYLDRRNIVYIITWDFAQIKYDFHIKNRESDLEVENIFLHSMFEIMKSKKGKPRMFRILFNKNDEMQLCAYNHLASLKFKAPKFSIQFVLYDVESNTKVEKVYK